VQTEVTAKALTEFMKELQDIHGKRPLTQKELEYARDSILHGYPLQFETNGEIAAALIEMAVFGLPEDHLTRFPREVAGVDAAAANRAARERLGPEGAAVVVVGDLSRIEDEVARLGVGTVVRLDAQGNPAGEEASSDD
jgi:zinc protease